MREQQFAHCVLMGVIALLPIPINAEAQGIPTANPLTYSGVAYQNSQPAPAGLRVDVTVISNGNVACMGTATTVAGGRFSAPLPNSCVSVVEGDNGIQIEVRLNSIILGQAAVTAAPYAVEAKNAQAAVNATNATNASNATGGLATTLAGLESRLAALEGRNLASRRASGTNQQLVANNGQSNSNVTLTGRVLTFNKIEAGTTVQVVVQNTVRLTKGNGQNPVTTDLEVRVGGQTCATSHAQVDFYQGGALEIPMSTIGACSGLSAGSHTISLVASGEASTSGGQVTYLDWDIQVTEQP